MNLENSYPYIFCLFIIILFCLCVKMLYDHFFPKKEGFQLSDIGDFFDKIINVFDQIGNFFKKLPEYFNDVGKFVVYIGQVFESIIKHIICGIDKLTKIFTTYCIIFYLLDLYINFILSIFYIVFELESYVIREVAGVNLDINGEIKNAYNEITQIITDMIGYNLFEYPQSVRNLCYSCDPGTFPSFPF